MACIDKKFDECLDIKDDANVPKQPEFKALYSANPVDSFISNEDTDKKVLALKYFLEKDLRAADLKWSLFVAACHTYRTDTCLRPFPPMYIKNDTKDIDSLVSWKDSFLLLYLLADSTFLYLEKSCGARPSIAIDSSRVKRTQYLSEQTRYNRTVVLGSAKVGRPTHQKY